MRTRDVNKVARGEQAPRPARDEQGTVSKAPPPSSTSTKVDSPPPVGNGDTDVDVSEHPPLSSDSIKVEEVKTAPVDMRFPGANQARHCSTRYLEYHKCIHAKGKGVPECEKFARYYRSLCPLEWFERWNERRELGIFPGPV